MKIFSQGLHFLKILINFQIKYCENYELFPIISVLAHIPQVCPLKKQTLQTEHQSEIFATHTSQGSPVSYLLISYQEKTYFANCNIGVLLLFSCATRFKQGSYILFKQIVHGQEYRFCWLKFTSLLECQTEACSRFVRLTVHTYLENLKWYLAFWQQLVKKN